MSIPVEHAGIKGYEWIGNGVAQVRNAVKPVVHPIAKGIRQYLASSHLMAAVERCQWAISVVWMRCKNFLKSIQIREHVI